MPVFLFAEYWYLGLFILGMLCAWAVIEGFTTRW